MDKRKFNGGVRPGAGRPPKADEIKLIEKLSPLDELAFRKLEEGIETGDFQFIKMFFEYRYGKAKETKDVNLEGSIITQIKLVDVDGSEI